MDTATQTNAKIGKGFPRSDANPEGYTLDERARRDKPKEKESKRGATGRKNSDGFEETIKIPPIKESCAEMMKLYKKMQAANENFNDCVKAVAERSNTNASNLKRLVKASAKGNYADVRRDIDQQSVLFESVGEIAGGKESEAA